MFCTAIVSIVEYKLFMGVKCKEQQIIKTYKREIKIELMQIVTIVKKKENVYNTYVNIMKS